MGNATDRWPALPALVARTVAWLLQSYLSLGARWMQQTESKGVREEWAKILRNHTATIVLVRVSITANRSFAMRLCPKRQTNLGEGARRAEHVGEEVFIADGPIAEFLE